MNQSLRLKILFPILVISVLVLGCNLTQQLLPGDNFPVGDTIESVWTSTPSLLPMPTELATTAITKTDPPPTLPPDTGWQSLRPGLEKRLITHLIKGAPVPERLYLLRIDPHLYRFDVGYHPGAPQQMVDWQSETGALIVVNGGYFTPENEATGLIIADGQQFGTSYQNFGGMFAVTEFGPELRWLPASPYMPGEFIQAGLQSFPVLVKPGGLVGYTEEDNLPARRTVIAQDREGRFLFLLAMNGYFSLHQLSLYLVESDLDVDIALNLDGGASTGLLLAEPVDSIPPFTPLPSVILVYPR